MAFTRAVGDTSISKERASKTLRTIRPVSPLTGRIATSGRLPTGRTALTYSSINVPRPARTAPPPDVASEGRRITGEQGSTGNPIGDAIGKAAKKLSPLIADAFSTPDNRQAAINLVDATESPLSNPGSFTPAPVAATTLPPFFTSEGGFIRKRT